jgi:hypothetical protein
MSELTSTAEKLEPRVKQFSIFLANKVGALMEIVKRLNERNIHVIAISIQDSADTAIVRIVVTDPDNVQEIFHEHEIPYSVCELCVVELKEGPTELGRMLASLLAAEVNIFGSYALLTHPRGRTALAVHVEDNECACSVLSSHGFNILGQADLSR